MKRFDDLIRDHLGKNHPWRDRILYFPTIGSTNTHAKTLAMSGAPEGTIVIAEQQSGGRGRLGRSFHSPPGSGIYLSVILRPNCPPAAMMHLTCAVGVAICDAIYKVTRLRPGIKWINDLIWQQRKLGGILAELTVNPRTGLVDYAAVGIGINCTQPEDDFPADIRPIATSLSIAVGQPIDRSRLAAAMIESLYAMREDLLQNKAAIMARYRSDCVTIGKEVAVHRFDQVLHGTAMDVDDDGGLLVRYPDGHAESVSAGEVSVRGMYGYV